MPSNDETRLQLVSIDQLSEMHPTFSAPAIRKLINRAGTNGLAPHIYRHGRRVSIDAIGFQDWLRAQQVEGAA